MIVFIKDLLIKYGVTENLALYISNVVSLILIVAISFITYFIVSKVLLKIIKSYTDRTKVKWDDILVEKKVFDRFFYIIPFAMIYTFAPLFPLIQKWIERLSFSAIIVIILLSADKLFDAINEIYNNFEISKQRPIKGYLQVVQIILYVISTFVVISILLDRSPLYLLSGIGAATAVFMLVFQNSILGLVASIQISSNKMLEIGDWIEMPKYGADGDVLEISLHTVKVQNFDKTITTIPTHLLISDSFKNWRGMQQSGSRRIKRSIYVDVNSIKLCRQKDIERICSLNFISDNLRQIECCSDRYSRNDNSNLFTQITNMGLFRRYLENYLKHHPAIIEDTTLMVRTLQPTEKGVPIEIYAFTNEITWENYEAVQADILDHIIAVINEFNLRIYQEPSGYDFNGIKAEY